MAEATLHEHQSRLLGLLTITAVQRLRAETFFIEEDGGVRQVRMARVGDVVLLDHPADATGPRSVDCYLAKVLDFDTAAAGGADAMRLKLGPDHVLGCSRRNSLMLRFDALCIKTAATCINQGRRRAAREAEALKSGAARFYRVPAY
jgi:hypothetical protein